MKTMINVKFLIASLLTLCFFRGFNQVSIGNNSKPHNNVILDLTNDDNKVLQLPKKTNLFPLGPGTEGVIIFDDVKEMIVYSTGPTLNGLSPWNFNPYVSDNTYLNIGGNVGINESTPPAKLTISGGSEASFSNYSSANGYFLIGNVSSNHLLFDDDEILAKDEANTVANTTTLTLQKQGGDVNVNGLIKQKGSDYVPQGTIMMWQGTVSGDHPVDDSGNPNTNWYICNGQNGTPNLKDRFIVGVGSDYGYEATGGTSYSGHYHKIDFDSETIGGGSHGHSAGSGNEFRDFRPGGCNDRDISYQYHGHPSVSSSHNHDINIPETTSYYESFDNRPEYYALYFIMKK